MCVARLKVAVSALRPQKSRRTDDDDDDDDDDIATCQNMYVA